MDEKNEPVSGSGEDSVSTANLNANRQTIVEVNRLLDYGLRFDLNGEIDNWWEYWDLDKAH